MENEKCDLIHPNGVKEKKTRFISMPKQAQWKAQVGIEVIGGEASNTKGAFLIEQTEKIR